LRASAIRKFRNGSLRIPPFAEIDKKVREGLYQFHEFGTCFVITQIRVYDNETVLEVVLLYGEGFLEKKAEVVEGLSKFGREQGCKAIEALSRLGLEPTLKPLGFRRTKILLRTEI
jgi:ABC-type phosphate/phosphonate transport system ATPase subunit